MPNREAVAKLLTKLQLRPPSVHQIYPPSCLPAPLSDDVFEQQEQQQLSEWTVWNRGMRLSLANGRIGLARLQQFTRSSCALHRVGQPRSLCDVTCLFSPLLEFIQ
ncbi:hypothetical protein AHF37_10483 [Paragonimus kellicotti]|nr:hypothetical protein AHF37_10483 [Paragonimus kellicotti]